MLLEFLTRGGDLMIMTITVVNIDHFTVVGWLVVVFFFFVFVLCLFCVCFVFVLCLFCFCFVFVFVFVLFLFFVQLRFF